MNEGTKGRREMATKRKAKAKKQYDYHTAVPLCQCGRKSYLDATHQSGGETVQHCPECDMPCRECECPDMQES